MAKDKRRKQKNKHDGLVSDEARYVLVGLLIFLLCFIGLIERGGYLGNVVSYVFVYVFGVFWFIPLLLVAFLGLYLFIRRKPLLKVCGSHYKKCSKEFGIFGVSAVLERSFAQRG